MVVREWLQMSQHIANLLAGAGRCRWRGGGPHLTPRVHQCCGPLVRAILQENGGPIDSVFQ